MLKRVSVTEMARNFSEYINRVLYRNEQFVLVRGNKSVAEIRPVPEAKRLADLAELWDTLPRLTEEEAAEFAMDLNEARESMIPSTNRDPWDI